MPRKRFLFVFNPIAGGGRSEERVRAICKQLERFQKSAHLRSVGEMGESRAIAAEVAQSSEYDVIVAVGGDGTIRQIAEGLHGTDAIMAILPMGTANVLVRELAQPRLRNPAAFAKFLIAADVVQIYPGEVIDSAGKSLFLSMASVGPDAETVAGISLDLKSRIGAGAYAIRGLREFLRGKREALAVSCDSGTYSGYWAIVSRSRYYGGRFRPGFTVRATDSALQTILFNGKGFYARTADALSLGLGSAPRRVGDRFFNDREVEISGEGGEPLQADGDIVAHLPATIRVSGQPISVLVRT